MNYFILTASNNDANWNIGMVSTVLTLIFSFAAIVISLIAIYQTNKNNITNLESNIYQEIFFPFLIKEIPDSQDEISYSNNNLSNLDPLIETLNALRKKAIFFKFRNKYFYKLLRNQIQKIEDFLVETHDTLEHDDFEEFNKQLRIELENLYSLIMNQYNGTSKK